MKPERLPLDELADNIMKLGIRSMGQGYKPYWIEEARELLQRHADQAFNEGLEWAANIIGDFNDTGYDEKTILCPKMIERIRAAKRNGQGVE